MIASIMAKPSAKATNGEMSIGRRTLSTTVAQLTRTPPAMAAPTRPPIRACEEDDGNPKYHVIRFQVIAPSSPAITITSPWLPVPGLMTSLTVCATF